MIETNDLIWQAPEYEAHERTALWYVGLGLVAAILVIMALWQENFLFAIFVVLAALTAAALSKEKPPLRTFTINASGLNIDGIKSLPFARLRGFSVEEVANQTDWATLVIHSKELFHHTLHIAIPRQKLADARALLLRRLKEVPHDPSLFEELLKFLKF